MKKQIKALLFVGVACMMPTVGVCDPADALLKQLHRVPEQKPEDLKKQLPFALFGAATAIAANVMPIAADAAEKLKKHTEDALREFAEEKPKQEQIELVCKVLENHINDERERDALELLNNEKIVEILRHEDEPLKYKLNYLCKTNKTSEIFTLACKKDMLAVVKRFGEIFDFSDYSNSKFISLALFKDLIKDDCFEVFKYCFKNLNGYKALSKYDDFCATNMIDYIKREVKAKRLSEKSADNFTSFLRSYRRREYVYRALLVSGFASVTIGLMLLRFR